MKRKHADLAIEYFSDEQDWTSKRAEKRLGAHFRAGKNF